jgi:hypothetical protein
MLWYTRPVGNHLDVPDVHALHSEIPCALYPASLWIPRLPPGFGRPTSNFVGAFNLGSFKRCNDCKQNRACFFLSSSLSRNAVNAVEIASRFEHVRPQQRQRKHTERSCLDSRGCHGPLTTSTDPFCSVHSRVAWLHGRRSLSSIRVAMRSLLHAYNITIIWK